ncbi:MAG: tyrosine-type recombinase/integrase [Propionivibrio sp.]|nr:tyrosine-type recombinase/integrase [Propionivibrio sp.]
MASFRWRNPGARFEKRQVRPHWALHGLRHSLASHLAMDGASSAELMESLGHKQVSTTMRYIHFAEKSKSTLAERAAATALAGLAESLGKPKADIVPMKKTKP